MIEYQNQSDLIACYDYCYIDSKDKFIGSIKVSDEEERYYFHPSRNAPLTCRQLRELTSKVSDLNLPKE